MLSDEAIGRVRKYGVVTIADLEESDACGTGKGEFMRAFPSGGVKVTKKLVKKLGEKKSSLYLGYVLTDMVGVDVDLSDEARERLNKKEARVVDMEEKESVSAKKLGAAWTKYHDAEDKAYRKAEWDAWTAFRKGAL